MISGVELRRRIALQPPETALVWASDALAGNIVSCQRMPGAHSAALHRVVVVDDGQCQRVGLLRRWVAGDLDRGDPRIAEHEAAALELVANVDVPTPRLIAVDPDAQHCDVPALLMTELRGRPRWSFRARSPWARLLSDALVQVHSAVIASGTQPRSYIVYEQDSYAPPRWSARPAVWERAVEIAAGPVPGPHVFIHRDFNPGNVLWDRSQISGVVDWQSACVGPPSIDIGHFRLNLLLAGARELADDLVDAWRAVSGEAYDPFGDVGAIVGMLDPWRTNRPNSRACGLIEDALAASVAALRG